MNDNGEIPPDRSDPFGKGVAAHREQHARQECPYPEAHVEARRWSAGWDHAAFKASGEPSVAGRIGGDPGKP